MEKLSQRESISLGYSPPGASNRSSDEVDFHDVFGGPPRRRSSIHQTRCSFSETADSFALKGDDVDAPPGRSSAWSGLNEKPVFGEENLHGRRFPSDEFFNDIFKGDEPVVSSPRRHEREVFSSIPGSRVLSPAKPLPPPAEPFGSSSLPAQFSLPSRLPKGTDLPAFGSTNSSPLSNKDAVSNASHTNYSRFTLSRFSSNTSSNRFEDLKTDNDSSDRTGVLSSESQKLSSGEALSFRKSDNALNGNSLTKGVEDSLEDSNGDGQLQFHFSIYKWASKGGVPLMLPLRGGNGSRLREKTLLRRSSSSTDRVVKEMIEMQSPTSTMHSIEFPTTNIDDEKGTDILPGVDAVYQRRPGRSFEDKVSTTPTANLSRQGSRKDVGGDNIIHQTTEKAKRRSLPEKISSSTTNEDQKHETKSLSSFLLYNDSEQSDEGKSEEYRKRDTTARSDKKSSNLSDLTSSPKKQDKQTSLRKSKVKKSSFISSDMESRQDIGKNKVGKISEFVKIFNQEPASKPRDVVHFEMDNPTTTRKQENSSKARTEATVNKISKKENPKLKVNTDASIKVEYVPKQPVDDQFKVESPAPNTGHARDVSKSTDLDVEEPFHVDFSVKELPRDYENSREADNESEELQAIDTKIRQWSSGKEGNIRSLLSTLQYVLWPKSGWKAVPLVDIIEGNAVKRSYQKALLYLHPDKLQQKGASSDQKYIAAKVFEILQEAWAHFNTLGGL